MSRLLIQTMVMTGSDLCASAKPWEQQIKTVAVIYEEFYIQVREGMIEYEVEGGGLMVILCREITRDKKVNFPCPS